jgi:hypothetical protein
MKDLIISVLILLGLYWLFDHHAPWPLSHDSLGLYYHTAHRIVGVVFLGLAVFFTWFWKLKK